MPDNAFEWNRHAPRPRICPSKETVVEALVTRTSSYDPSSYTLMPDNALERIAGHRGPRLSAAQRRWPAAQLDR
jgi:hypothetical protein